MDELNGLATRIGEATCQNLWRGGYAVAERFLCSDGSYSAGWKILGVAMVFLGLVLAWVLLGRGARRNHP